MSAMGAHYFCQNWCRSWIMILTSILILSISADTTTAPPTKVHKSPMSSQPSGKDASVDGIAEDMASLTSKDAALARLLDIIADGCDSTHHALRRAFRSLPDLQLLASADSEAKTTTIFNQLRLNIMQLVRLDAVLQYFRGRGKYQIGMKIESINEFNRHMSHKRSAPSSLNSKDWSSASPSSLSSLSSAEPTSSIESKPTSSRANCSEECNRNESCEVRASSSPNSTFSSTTIGHVHESASKIIINSDH